jgi:hypothetical protein
VQVVKQFLGQSAQIALVHVDPSPAASINDRTPPFQLSPHRH